MQEETWKYLSNLHSILLRSQLLHPSKPQEDLRQTEPYLREILETVDPIAVGLPLFELELINTGYSEESDTRVMTMK